MNSKVIGQRKWYEVFHIVLPIFETWGKELVVRGPRHLPEL